MRLSEASRLRAIGQIEAGRRFQDVANDFGVHCSTISRLHEKYVATGSVKDLPRPGRPRVTTLRQDRAIRLQHLRRRFQAATETARGIRGPNRRQISSKTVRRRLKTVGLRCRRPYHGSRLTGHHRDVRTRWATLHARWLRRQWQNVLFTDECKVMVDSSDKRQHVYRRRGERYSDACVKEVDRWGRASTMIWAGISYHGKTDLVFLNDGVGRGARRGGRRGGITAQRYIDEVLRPVAVPYLRTHQGMLLQHDNARPHVARLTTQYLHNANVNVMDNWPALSADVNPIEHCWDYIKKRIRCLELNDAPALQVALRREWQRLPLAYIRRLVGSMRRRCVAVVNARGGHTRY